MEYQVTTTAPQFMGQSPRQDLLGRGYYYSVVTTWTDMQRLMASALIAEALGEGVCMEKSRVWQHRDGLHGTGRHVWWLDPYRGGLGKDI